MAKELPIVSVTRQAHRDRIVAACVLGRRDATAEALQAWSKLEGIKDLERTETEALVDRCVAGIRP
jgi:hypothetical protein